MMEICVTNPGGHCRVGCIVKSSHTDNFLVFSWAQIKSMLQRKNVCKNKNVQNDDEQQCFSFKDYNYSSLSGSFDHWKKLLNLMPGKLYFIPILPL